jgi:hypothetical protein
MTLGIVTVKATNHVLGVYSTVATPNPQDPTALVNLGFPFRGANGDVVVLVPVSELGAQPASDSAPDRVATALRRPQLYYYDDKAKEFAPSSPTTGIALTTTTLQVPNVGGGSPLTLQYVIAVQDNPLPGNVATVFTDSIVADNTVYTLKHSLPSGKILLFVEGFLPLVK